MDHPGCPLLEVASNGLRDQGVGRGMAHSLLPGRLLPYQDHDGTPDGLGGLVALRVARTGGERYRARLAASEAAVMKAEAGAAVRTSSDDSSALSSGLSDLRSPIRLLTMDLRHIHARC